MTQSDKAVKEATLLILTGKEREARGAANYYETAAVFAEAASIPEDAPAAYKIAERALRDSIIETAIFHRNQSNKLAGAIEKITMLGVTPV